MGRFRRRGGVYFAVASGEFWHRGGGSAGVRNAGAHLEQVNIWREIVEDGAGLAENDDLAGTTRC